MRRRVEPDDVADRVREALEVERRTAVHRVSVITRPTPSELT